MIENIQMLNLYNRNYDTIHTVIKQFKNGERRKQESITC